jgi:hypothetical protein
MESPNSKSSWVVDGFRGGEEDREELSSTARGRLGQRFDGDIDDSMRWGRCQKNAMGQEGRGYILFTVNTKANKTDTWGPGDRWGL